MSDRVFIRPIPRWARTLSPRLWPSYPPVFPLGEPTADELALARELYLALDPMSQRFYARLRPRLGLPPLPPEKTP